MTPIGLPPKMRCITKPTPSRDLHQLDFFPQEFQQQPKAFTDDYLQRNLQQYGNQYHRNNPFAPGYGDATMSTTMPTDMMSQMMNTPCYQQQQMSQQYFPYQQNSFEDVPSTKTMYERNLQFQQMQQYQAMKRDFLNNSGGMSTGSSSGFSSASSSLAAYEARMQQQYSRMSGASSSLFNRFDPPKPDTPPSKPLWLDPVWQSDGNFFNNRNSGSNFNQERFVNPDLVRATSHFLKSFLSFRLFKGNSFNFHVVSPYMSFKTMFTFDNANNSGNQQN